MFYCVFPPDNAFSSDLKTWEPIPEDTPLLSSKDLKTWDYREPLYAPNLHVGAHNIPTCSGSAIGGI